MKKMVAMSVGLASLAGTALPAMVFMAQSLASGTETVPPLSLDAVKATMLVSAVAWFAAAPFWMRVR